MPRGDLTVSSGSETYTASHVVVQARGGGNGRLNADLESRENGLGEHFQRVVVGPMCHGHLYHLYPGRCQLSQLNPPQVNAVTVKSE